SVPRCLRVAVDHVNTCAPSTVALRALRRTNRGLVWCAQNPDWAWHGFPNHHRVSTNVMPRVGPGVPGRGFNEPSTRKADVVVPLSSITRFGPTQRPAKSSLGVRCTED